jgi:hypothetical protein
LIFADSGLWFARERHDDLAVQALPDVRHKAATVAVEPAFRQLLGKGGQVFTRAMSRKLKGVETLSDNKTAESLLGFSTDDFIGGGDVADVTADEAALN